ncbi:MAG: polyribonucleotide nucleotidyltransferase, partial [Chloroflexi bacterium]|nr:polyribonucleotide nucleotidyltransferase [Chloroflexota bacterium]NOH13618.1 polyribonucleotide nucleotidyltransferase [Chloroflexota bacterium]
MKPEAKQYSAMVGGKPLTMETGKLAGQAGGAVTVQYGETMLFAVVTMNHDPRPGIDFLPLSVDYEERMYAGGQIPGGFFRREGRPGEAAILTNRLTDRPLRPLFPKGMRNDVQVILYALSHDGENPMDILAINGASAALTISDVPWDGPVGAVRVGRIDGKLVANPTFADQEISDLDLRVAATREAILMVECGAEEVSEETIVEALQFAHDSIQPIVDMQEQMQKEIGKEKREPVIAEVNEELKAKVVDHVSADIANVYEQGLDKAGQRDALKVIRESAIEEFTSEDEDLKSQIYDAFDAAQKSIVRNRILEESKRPDGRGATDIRDIWVEVDLSPRAHGSGVFTRGETQVMTMATLGTPRDAQAIDNLTPTDKKRYMHHYNFPPFSVGETRFLRGTSRREIGHGALAERALEPVIPDEKEFPYTIRLVSECLSSNGSTSMGSVCGSTLALMDTGVPIKAPVSGIAMGLVKEGDKYAILSDIQGLEDHLGDMDFKVAGTDKGITALQMDIKIKGLTAELMSEALEQAKAGRSHILNKMLEVIPVPNPELKQHTPRISTVSINPSKIGAVIGPGGKTIRGIQEETGAQIDIEEDGTIFIATADGDSEARARDMVMALTEEAEVGRIYTGKVVRTTDFGAFVEILPGNDGLVHISQLDSERVESVEDVAKVGDEITVMVTNIDPAGKIRLSRQAVLEGWTAEEAREKDSGGRKGGGNRGGNRGG